MVLIFKAVAQRTHTLGDLQDPRVSLFLGVTPHEERLGGRLDLEATVQREPTELVGHTHLAPSRSVVFIQS